MDKVTDLVLMKMLEIAFEYLMYLAMVKIICVAFGAWGRIFMRMLTRDWQEYVAGVE